MLLSTITDALIDAGVSVVTHVPASGVTEVYDAFCDQAHSAKIYSYHEEVAFAIGMYLAGYQPVWSVVGDFSFVAAAHLGLAEAIQRHIPLKVLIFNNGVAAATGGQPLHAKVLEHIISGYRSYLHTIRFDADLTEMEKMLIKVKHSDRLEIVSIEF